MDSVLSRTEANLLANRGDAFLCVPLIQMITQILPAELSFPPGFLPA
jgi:hypothetical protein